MRLVSMQFFSYTVKSHESRKSVDDLIHKESKIYSSSRASEMTNNNLHHK